MARALMRAFETAGATVTLAHDLRVRDGRGDDAVQRDLMARAEALVPDLVSRGRQAGWQAWITYHSYYKAPDLPGAAVARALGIPYLLIEATRARKRLGGPWDRFARAAEAACDAADTVFYLTHRDRDALAAYGPATQRLIHLPPFLPRSDLPPLAKGQNLLAVGMMREAAKLPSYELIARTLQKVPDAPDLDIAGDGPARDAVARAMVPLHGRVHWLGGLDKDALSHTYARARALIWPGVDEAFGMTYLEAQAHGLPVIAQDRPGVRDVLYPGDYPAPEDGADGLAAHLRATLAHPPDPHAIRAWITKNHLLPAASATLAQGLSDLGVSP
ncbi:glycosyltransferase family 4 protein [Sulfitobacter albidus]|uniref:Glycosyltransferase family 4 protein n=2 Tax=Sulfitobacter albidus TaxID=2829501 RepID=A0A975PNJ4_9RHOB|nr:glycosyltransferase family 4 protein [Sulfitobacter albidus]